MNFVYKNKIIFIHQGALGDRILVWPLLYAFAKYTDICAPDMARLFWGRDHTRAWQQALGYGLCPPALETALSGVYSGGCSPELSGARLVWLWVHTAPFPLPEETSGVECLPLFTAPPGARRHASCAVLEQAMRAGLLPDQDVGPLLVSARQAWQKHFGGRLDGPGERGLPVLLVPGAGHRAKQWPLERFVALAGALRGAGHTVVWILGPAEQERGMVLPETEVVCRPRDLEALAALLRSARLVVGNDSGPAHLAAMYGAPVLSLFGPTDPVVWRPLGAEVLGSPSGLEGISVDQVLETALRMIEEDSPRQGISPFGKAEIL